MIQTFLSLIFLSLFSSSVRGVVVPPLFRVPLMPTGVQDKLFVYLAYTHHLT